MAAQIRTRYCSAARRWVAAGFVLSWLITAAYAVASDTPKVSITGGADTSGQNYTWTVTNHYASPIVFVEFPHYHAGVFFPPKGWESEATAIVEIGYKEEPGVCIGRTDSLDLAIDKGESGAFRMKIAPLPTRRGKGTVRVRFADRTEAAVAGVELPQQELIGDQYAPLIGLGVIFLVFVIVRTVRAKRRRGGGTGAA